MNDPYEEFADLFMQSMVAQLSGITRSDFLRQARERYPDPEEFAAVVRTLRQQARMLVDELRQQGSEESDLSIGCAIDRPRGYLH